MTTTWHKGATACLKKGHDTWRKIKVLKYLMFLKEKHDGTNKAQGCADGLPQRLYTTKQEASSPKVSLEAMMLSCTFDAK